MLYVSWAALGGCMAATLYEPVFAMIGRTLEPRHQLRALATITVLGGLASTVFLPLTAALIDRVGWQAAVWSLAACLAATTAIVGRVALSGILVGSAAPSQAGVQQVSQFARRGTGFDRVLVVFCCTSFASTAFTTSLVPALIARGISPLRAAMLAGLLGIMQLSGRVVLMSGVMSARPWRLLAVSLLLQAAGLSVVGGGRSVLAIAAGVAIFASGAGLTTLIRPHLVNSIVGPDRAGCFNGIVVRWQLLARATGPIAAAGLAGIAGYGAVFALFAAMLTMLAVFSPPDSSVFWSRTMRRTPGLSAQRAD